VQSKEWIDLLTEHWLPLTLKHEGEMSWVKHYVRLLGKLCPEYTDEAAALWLRAFEEDWSDPESVATSVISAIRRQDSGVLRSACMLDVLGKVTQAMPIDRPEFDYPLGQYVSESVDANQGRHDVLKKYLFKESAVSKSSSAGTKVVSFHDLEPNVDFHRDGFLADYLKESGGFLTHVISRVEKWGQVLRSDSTTSTYNRGNLICTRWEQERSDHDHDFKSRSNRFFCALEDALKHHARENTEWWEENELTLRESKDLGIRYMVVQAYRENIEANLVGIEAHICDTTFHLQADMNHEIGCLMQEAFPLLSQEVRAKSQHSILDIRNKVDLYREGKPTRWVKIIYDCLNRVPRCFRTQETAQFLDQWESHFGTAPSQPRVRSYGGFVPPPVSPIRLCSLSAESVLRLLRHFDDIRHSFRQKSGGIMGGRDSFLKAISDAAGMAPVCFLERVKEWSRNDVDNDYIRAVYKGVAWHCMYRFGNVSPGDKWEPMRPMVSREYLSDCLFHIAETSKPLWQDLNTARRVVEIGRAHV